MRRLIVKEKDIVGDEIHVSDPDAVFYLTVVLRMGVGDGLVVSDGAKNMWEAYISEIGRDRITLRILSGQAALEGYKTRVTLYQGLPKGAKLEGIIRASTELGVYRIVPTNTARSIPNADDGVSAARLKRWRKIAEEATRQSGRVSIPEVVEPVKFSKAADGLKGEGYDLILAMYELEESLTLKQALRQAMEQAQNQVLEMAYKHVNWQPAEEAVGQVPEEAEGQMPGEADGQLPGEADGQLPGAAEGQPAEEAPEQADRKGRRRKQLPSLSQSPEEKASLAESADGEWYPKVALFIGPEGGFESEEISRLVQEGAQSVSMGETILRTETAGPAAIAMILYELEM